MKAERTSQRKAPEKIGACKKTTIKRRFTQIGVGVGSTLAIAAAEETWRRFLDHASDIALALAGKPVISVASVVGGGLVAAATSRSARAAAWRSLARLRSIVWVLTLSITLVVIAASGSLADALTDRFALIKIGLTPAAVEAILGPPTSHTITQAPLGVVVETMRWSVPGRTYLVRLAGFRRTDGARVIEKKICEGAVSC